METPKFTKSVDVLIGEKASMLEQSKSLVKAFASRLEFLADQGVEDIQLEQDLMHMEEDLQEIIRLNESNKHHGVFRSELAPSREGNALVSTLTAKPKFEDELVEENEAAIKQLVTRFNELVEEFKEAYPDEYQTIKKLAGQDAEDQASLN